MLLQSEPFAGHPPCTKALLGKACPGWTASKCIERLQGEYICISACETDDDCKPEGKVCRKGPVGNKRCAPVGWKDES